MVKTASMLIARSRLAATQHNNIRNYNVCVNNKQANTISKLELLSRESSLESALWLNSEWKVS